MDRRNELYKLYEMIKLLKQLDHSIFLDTMSTFGGVPIDDIKKYSIKLDINLLKNVIKINNKLIKTNKYPDIQKAVNSYIDTLLTTELIVQLLKKYDGIESTNIDQETYDELYPTIHDEDNPQSDKLEEEEEVEVEKDKDKEKDKKELTQYEDEDKDKDEDEDENNKNITFSDDESEISGLKKQTSKTLLKAYIDKKESGSRMVYDDYSDLQLKELAIDKNQGLSTYEKLFLNSQQFKLFFNLDISYDPNNNFITRTEFFSMTSKLQQPSQQTSQLNLKQIDYSILVNKDEFIIFNELLYKLINLIYYSNRNYLLTEIKSFIEKVLEVLCFDDLLYNYYTNNSLFIHNFFIINYEIYFYYELLYIILNNHIFFDVFINYIYTILPSKIIVHIYKLKEFIKNQVKTLDFQIIEIEEMKYKIINIINPYIESIIDILREYLKSFKTSTSSTSRTPKARALHPKIMSRSNSLPIEPPITKETVELWISKLIESKFENDGLIKYYKSVDRVVFNIKAEEINEINEFLNEIIKKINNDNFKQQITDIKKNLNKLISNINIILNNLHIKNKKNEKIKKYIFKLINFKCYLDTHIEIISKTYILLDYIFFKLCYLYFINKNYIDNINNSDQYEHSIYVSYANIKEIINLLYNIITKETETGSLKLNLKISNNFFTLESTNNIINYRKEYIAPIYDDELKKIFNIGFLDGLKLSNKFDSLFDSLNIATTNISFTNTRKSIDEIVTYIIDYQTKRKINSINTIILKCRKLYSFFFSRFTKNLQILKINDYLPINNSIFNLTQNIELSNYNKFLNYKLLLEYINTNTRIGFTLILNSPTYYVFFISLLDMFFLDIKYLDIKTNFNKKKLYEKYKFFDYSYMYKIISDPHFTQTFKNYYTKLIESIAVELQILDDNPIINEIHEKYSKQIISTSRFPKKPVEKKKPVDFNLDYKKVPIPILFGGASSSSTPTPTPVKHLIPKDTEKPVSDYTQPVPFFKTLIIKIKNLLLLFCLIIKRIPENEITKTLTENIIKNKRLIKLKILLKIYLNYFLSYIAYIFKLAFFENYTHKIENSNVIINYKFFKKNPPRIGIFKKLSKDTKENIKIIFKLIDFLNKNIIK